MITVIKHGKMKYKNQSTCPICGCVFAYHDSDIKSKDSYYNNPVYFIYCPDCGYQFTGFYKDELT